jgi:hypothetical protein
MNRSRLAVLIAITLFMACAPMQRGVVGPGQGYALGLWRGEEFRLLDFRTPSGARQTATEAQARTRWNLTGTWRVVEYHPEGAPNEATVLVGDLRAIDGRDGLANLDALIATVRRDDLAFLAEQEPPARAILASPNEGRSVGEHDDVRLVPQTSVTGVRLDGATSPHS